jgi:hypothetical protein
VAAKPPSKEQLDAISQRIKERVVGSSDEEQDVSEQLAAPEPKKSQLASVPLLPHEAKERSASSAAGTEAPSVELLAPGRQSKGKKRGLNVTKIEGFTVPNVKKPRIALERDSGQWHYIDRQGCEQGPFQWGALVEWHKAGHMTGDVSVKNGKDGVFYKLSVALANDGAPYDGEESAMEEAEEAPEVQEGEDAVNSKDSEGHSAGGASRSKGGLMDSFLESAASAGPPEDGGAMYDPMEEEEEVAVDTTTALAEKSGVQWASVTDTVSVDTAVETGAQATDAKVAELAESQAKASVAAPAAAAAEVTTAVTEAAEQTAVAEQAKQAEQPPPQPQPQQQQQQPAASTQLEPPPPPMRAVSADIAQPTANASAGADAPRPTVPQSSTLPPLRPQPPTGSSQAELHKWLFVRVNCVSLDQRL